MQVELVLGLLTVMVGAAGRECWQCGGQGNTCREGEEGRLTTCDTDITSCFKSQTSE